MMDQDGQTLERREHWASYEENKVNRIDAIYKSNPTCHLVRQAIVKAVKYYAPNAKTLIDVGCGTGEVAIALFDEGFRVTGLDISSSMLERFKLNMDVRDIKLIKGDVFTLPTNFKYDIATARYVFSHYNDFKLLLKQIADHVVSGGIIVFDSFSSDSLKRGAAAAGISKGGFGRRAYSKLAHFSHGELELACGDLGLLILKRYPAAFFHRNPLFISSFEIMTDYDAELEQHLKDPGVQRFMTWFHERITPNMDSMYSGQIINVIRKI